MEQRLTELTERCAEILNRWTATDARHAQAVGQVEERLGEWNAIETRLQRDAVQRLRELETTIEHEWKSLRQMHEEPIRQLREQAASLGETCRTAATLALQSFEKAETRIAALEADLQGRLTRLSSDVAALAARTDAPRTGQLPSGGPAPFPLDGVMAIHDELRGGDAPPVASLAKTAPTPAPKALPEQALALTARMDSLEREITSEREEVRAAASRTARMDGYWRLLLAILIMAIIGGGAYAGLLQRRFSAEIDAASSRAAAAEREAAAATVAASKQIAESRADADRQIAEARDTARQAQLTSNILAAPDLVRLTLIGTGSAADAIAHIHWSRAQGLIVNALRLPAAPAGSTYQLWLLGETPVSAGFLTPDAERRAAIVGPNPPGIPRPVTGVLVTLEPAGGSAAPAGAIVLQRPPVSSPEL